MSRLSNVKNSFVMAPPRIIVYGEGGIGKSTLASMAPNPIFINSEDGLRNIHTNEFDNVKTFEDIMECLQSLAEEEHDYKTVCLDTLDWIESLCFKSVCEDEGVTSILAASGGFRNGFQTVVDTKWKRITKALDYLSIKKNMYVICLAHQKIATIKPPDADPYDMYQLKLDEKANAHFFEWADIVMRAYRKMTVVKQKGNHNQAKPIGTGGGERVMQTVGTPSCMCKTKWNIPEEIPLNWNDFERVISSIN